MAAGQLITVEEVNRAVETYNAANKPGLPWKDNRALWSAQHRVSAEYEAQAPARRARQLTDEQLTASISNCTMQLTYGDGTSEDRRKVRENLDACKAEKLARESRA